MKSKLLTILTSIMLSYLCLFMLTACENGDNSGDTPPAHEHSYTQVVTQPTCEAQGFTTNTCDCGDVVIDTYVNALGHSFTNYVSDNNATYEADGTKTAKCDNCDATDTIVDEGSKLTSQTGQISFSTLSLEGLNAYGVVSNKVDEFNFNNEVTVSGNATYVVSYDKYGSQQVLTKIVPLYTGNNTFYVFEMQGTNITKTYEVTIRRRPMHNVSFNTLGSYVESQSIEEDSLATEPTIIPTRAGYTFNGWNYDFTTPITGYTTIDAKWTANTDTPYKVEYYLQNLNGYDYTIDNSLTENLTGTTDTTANAEIKDIEHFTAESQTVSGNINGNGTTVLKVYYTRNSYNLTLTALNNKGSVSGIYNGKYKYDKEVTLTATLNAGYAFTGWYNGEELLSDKTTYTFNVDKELDIVGKWTANTDTQYKVEYYLQNLNGYGYTIDNSLTENLTGTTDTTANAEIKEIEHFTAESQTVSGNINGNGTTVLKVYYTRDTYTVTFDGDGGTLSSGKVSHTVKYGGSVTAPTFTKTGYTFTGYNKTNYDNISESFTVTASWQINQYTITIVYGNGEEDKTITQDYNTPIEDIENPERGGYTFNGWDKVIPTIMPAKNTTITAKWLAIFTLSDNGITGLTSHGKTLSEIIIPECVDGVKITSIGSSAFYGCTSLTKVNYLGTIDSWAQIEFGDYYANPLVYAKNLYINDELVTEAVLTSATKISDYAFLYCTSLTSIVIPDRVTSIGFRAFDDCDSFTKVNYLGTIDSWAQIEFGNYYANPLVYAKNLYINDELVTEAVLTSATKISDYAFLCCTSLTSIVMPDSVTSIGEGAFSNCTSLTKVNYLGTIDSWAQIEFSNSASNPLYYANNLYINDVLVTEVVIMPATKISSYAFYNCMSLTSIVIPDSVTSVGEEAFYNCMSLKYKVKDNLKYLGNSENPYLYLAGTTSTSITTATIDNNCKIIGSHAFSGCTSLTSVVIPDSVTSIGSYAFLDCDSLTSIYCEVNSRPNGWNGTWNVATRYWPGGYAPSDYYEYTYHKTIWGYKG